MLGALSRPEARGAWAAWWVSAVCCVHHAVVLASHRRISLLWLLMTAAPNELGRTTRLCEKKYDPSVARVEIFFSGNPQGSGLAICPTLGKFVV